jgi:phospholipase/carboxylesterase
MQDDLLIHRPDPTQTTEPQLLLLFHGIGSRPEDLQPLGQVLAARRPSAWVVSVRSPDRSDFGQGWQWFSVQGITEANRPGRVAAAMPAFRQVVAAWQEHSGVPAARTALIGFSQGAITALESTQHPGPAAASRVIAIAGRFAQPPHTPPVGTVVNLVHGEQDGVVPVRFAIDAEAQLKALGAPATLDLFAGLGHGIDTRVVDAMVRRLDHWLA